ncbi:hypothetical protein PTTG_01157 [Puccinia triticina 1-1 BBBD Race 1]|uniref:J domain-containing protein n=2 Tax=Puccinia triticina TaxID=208348 RepID=A0A180H0W1_PUCT1|nr:uncharacterized protein PtA15_10A380 [Puccinia triticina]OAV98132.1 hypothetical protein PTTG_01157 [Puccinia triticina 1-1 BBBD Race 1]WAQ88957.1 hypothetical protein PtA15_10A380 [Puccinia triticina]
MKPTRAPPIPRRPRAHPLSTIDHRTLARLQHPSFSTCACRRQENHYRTLGLTKEASARQIKSNFYELSRTHHPDMNPSGASSAERFKKISEAYSVLSDPAQRKRYDETLSASGVSGAGDPGTTYAGMTAEYGSRNAERRANANYAWSTRASRAGPRADPRARRSDPLRSAQQAGDFSASLDRFERLARRRKPPSASASAIPDDPWSDPLHNPSPTRPRPKASPAQQAAQMALMLSLIFWVGSKLQL